MLKNPKIQAILPTSHKIFKSRAFIALAVLFVAGKILIALFAPSRNLAQADDLTPDSIFRAVNEQRSLRNLITLNANSKLTQAGQSKADDMQARHYFAHVDPDGHYIWDKIVAAGYTPYVQLGENLAIEFYDTESLMSAWMNSPTHRANILQEEFRDDGMGIAFGSASAGQYHSAVANTFGTLANAPQHKNPEPPPQPAPTPSPSPAALPAFPTFFPSTNQPPPANPRQGQSAPANPNVNFALPSFSNAGATATLPAALSGSAVIGDLKAKIFGSSQANRYLILLCGIGLLLLILSDIKTAIEEKFASLDKKINNLIVLLISLVVIAFMYWL